ncbi:MAG: ribosome silencing factor [Candidatus Marinimicrobia bacterium]|nr:ribosome silencing factor [Candidatus Neomarinimicrobiota bacterium]
MPTTAKSSTLKKSIESTQLADIIGKLTLTKKAENVLSIDVRKVSSSADYFIICSAETGIQVSAIVNAVRKGTPAKPWHIEGLNNQNWVLLDYIDVVLHVFKTQTREFYSLEKLWADAPTVEITDEPQKQSQSTSN